jgi:hypothetical protein
MPAAARPASSDLSCRGKIRERINCACGKAEGLGTQGFIDADIANTVRTLRYQRIEGSDLRRQMSSRQRVRLISMAWGESYIGELFNYALPALLAPGNLPELVKEFDCEVVLVTEEAWFDRLRQHPSYRRIAEYCPIELRPVDEFVHRADAYGMALTFALFRGFEELGPAMLETYLVFFNTDFIMADGSLRSVARKIREGERLILSPSYCVVLEEVMPQLAARRDADGGVLAMPPREMAALAIRHRHNTIRGKTINQRLVSMARIDQFYWLVDENTLIGHQLPIAVVCMRPTRLLTEMRTFWDYGILSEACPGVTPCILGDSDDCLMIELRHADTAREQLSLGWPTPEQIARDLQLFITSDPIRVAGHTLVLHAGEIPAEFAVAKRRLDDYVESVLRLLPAELTDHIDHPIWAYHHDRFQQSRRDYLVERGLLTEDLLPAASQLPQLIFPAPTEPFKAGNGRVPQEKATQVSKLTRFIHRFARRTHKKLFGVAPHFSQLHPRWVDVQPILRPLASTPGERLLIVSSKGLEEALFQRVYASHVTVGDVIGATDRRPPSNAATRTAKPGLAVAPALEAISDVPRTLRIDDVDGLPVTLSFADGETSKSARLIRLELSWRDVLPQPAPSEQPLPDPVAKYLPEEPGDAPFDNDGETPVTAEFDLCICELSADDLRDVRALVRRLTPCVRTSGSILVFHLNRRFGAHPDVRMLILEDALALELPARFHFTGSELGAKAILDFHIAWGDLLSGRAPAIARGAVQLVRSVSRARRASRAVSADTTRPPDFLTSFVIEVSVTRAAAEAEPRVPSAKPRLRAET